MTLRALQRPPEKDRDERNGLSPSEEPRIRLGDLPERSKDSTPRDVLRGLEGAEGTSCARDCDCAEGLVCRRGACTGDW